MRSQSLIYPFVTRDIMFLFHMFISWRECLIKQRSSLPIMAITSVSLRSHPSHFGAFRISTMVGAIRSQGYPYFLVNRERFGATDGVSQPLDR